MPEIHTYIGPGINNFGCPCVMTADFSLWWSSGTAWDAEADTSKKSTTVFAANDALLKQGSKAKGRQHHLMLAMGKSLLPSAPVAVWGNAGVHLPGEWVDLINQDKGESTAIFAPRHVKADIDGSNEVATLRWPGGGCVGPANLSVCCDPIDSPFTLAHQTPNTVFLGMTTADTAGCMIGWFIAAVANGVVKLMIQRVAGIASRQLARYLARVIGRAATAAIRQLLRLARWAGVRAVDFGASSAIQSALGSFFNVAEARFDHTAIDDDIADDWDEYVVSP
jgi:hypothetical protein